MKYLVCILVSSRLDILEHSVKSVEQQNCKDVGYDIYIVVNTQDEYFFQEVLDKYKSKNRMSQIKVVRTESNGKPGKGHNSVINLFKNKILYDFLIMLDGDDFLFPTALKKIDYIYRNQESCEIILHVGQTIFRRDENDKIKLEPSQIIKKISQDYNTTLATPFRFISANRAFVDNLEEDVYNEEAMLYDDYKLFLYIYDKIRDTSNFEKENVCIMSDPYMYIYNKNNENSAHKKCFKIKDDAICKQMIKKYNIETLECEKINIKHYWEIGKNPRTNKEHEEDKIINEKYRADFIKLWQDKIGKKPKVLFLDFNSWSHKTIETRPLGGTETAIINLATELSNNSVEVCVMTCNGLERKVVNDNLVFMNMEIESILSFNPTHIVYQACNTSRSVDIDKLLPNAKKIYYVHHDINVRFIEICYDMSKEENKKNHVNVYKYVFVSSWQRNRYIEKYKIPYNKCVVLQNGISPLVNMKNSYNKTKTMIFTSTPYRGIIPAYQLFQEVKKLIPDIKLKVFSCFNRDRSCSLAEAEEKAYKPLERIDELIDFDENGRPVQNHFNMTNNYYSSVYDLLMKDPNVEFYGSVPQKVLFKHIEEAMCLFYPNTFMETCCINALEAMAMRCNVLTSNLGALGETTKMFGSLIDLGIDVDRSPDTHISNPVRYVDIPETYKRRFVNETVRIIENYWSESNQQLLNEQQNYIEKECFWKSRCKKMLDVL